jgi:pimeloyl-ACP methyl ester carboxylesterase
MHRGHVRGERLNDGLSAVAVGEGPPLVVLPGLGGGADLSVRVPRTAAWSTTALAGGLQRTVHLIHRPVRPPSGMTIAELARWHATALRERFGEPVDVIGISAGGVTALQLTLDHSRTVRRLVLCVAASRVAERGSGDLLRMVELERQGRSAARIGSRLIAHGPLRLLLAAFGLSRNRPREPGEAAPVRHTRVDGIRAALSWASRSSSPCSIVQRPSAFIGPSTRLCPKLVRLYSTRGGASA